MTHGDNLGDLITRCSMPFAVGHHYIAWADPKLTLVGGDTYSKSSCGAKDILQAPEGASWVFGNPKWKTWLMRDLLPTMCHDLGGAVKAHFMGAFACKEGSKIDIPKIEGLGAFLIYLPSECEGGAISLSFDERKPIIFETALPNELSTIVWFQEVEYHHAPVRKDSQGVLLYRITRDDSAAQSSAIGPVTRNRLRDAFQQLSAQDSEVQYFVWSEESATIEGAIEVPVDSRVRTIEQACAEGTCHCFLARLKRRTSYERREFNEVDEDVPSCQYFLDELQCLTGLGVLTVPELHVAGDFLPTKLLYSGSRKMEKIILENRDEEYCDIQQTRFDQILVVVTQQRLVSFLCPKFCSELEALKLLQQLSEGPQLELARSICQQIRHPSWFETWSGPLLVTAVRLGELDLAHTIGQQLEEPLAFSTLTALGQQYQISEDSNDKMRLDKVHWQCIRLEGQGHYLQVSYYALKVFFAGLNDWPQNHKSIMFHNCLYILLTDETVPVLYNCLKEVICDLIGLPVTTSSNGKNALKFQYPPNTDFARHLLLFGVRKCQKRLESGTSRLYKIITELYEDWDKQGQTASQQFFFDQFDGTETTWQ